MMQTKKDHLDLGDGKLYYETAGKGMPLVLSHAAFLDSRMFDYIWEPLSKAFPRDPIRHAWFWAIQSCGRSALPP